MNWNSPEKQREYLAEEVKPSTVIYTLTEYRNNTRHVRVYVSSARNKIRDITWMVGKACGYTVRESAGSGWHLTIGGSGFSAGLNVYLSIRHTLGHQKPGSVEGQNKWVEL